MTKDEFIDGISALKQSEWFNRGKEYKGLIITYFSELAVCANTFVKKTTYAVTAAQ